MAGLWSAASGAQWTIGSGAHRATLVEVGGGLREYTVAGVPMIDPYPAESICPKSAGQVLAPWPNRIRDGQYSFGGAEHQLPINEVPRHNAMHGLARWLSWHRVEQTPESLELTCMLPPQPGYPYALCLTTRWTVSDAGLRADHTAANVGTKPAPFGLGAHPYLRVDGADHSDLRLRLPASERLVTDDRMLPTGREELPGTDFDFTEPRAVGDLNLDTPFTGLSRDADGLARARLTDGAGDGVELWQDSAFGWVQVYSGAGPSGRRRGSLAIEPMTCPPDAFRSGESLTVLAPGERWSGSWGIAPLR